MIASRVLTRAAPRVQLVNQQKRGFLDYLTNYPDRVRATIHVEVAY